MQLGSLGAVVAAFYVLEGAALAPRGAVAFSRRPGGRFVVRRPVSRHGSARRGLLLPDPWAPVERFTAWGWPIALSPAGLAHVTPSGAMRQVALQDTGTLEAAGASLRLAGRRIAFAGPPAFARALVALVRNVATLPPDEREARIREAVVRGLDVREARRRLRRLRRVTRATRFLPAVLCANLLLTGPVLSAIVGSARAWPVWLAVHVVLVASALTEFLRATRRLGLASDDHVETVTMLALFPPAAAHYRVALTRHLFSGLHPLAVAAALLDRPALLREVRRFLADQPAGQRDAGVGEPDAGATAAWFHDLLRREALAMLERAGLPASEVFRAPQRESGADRYCPRCRTQYRRGVTACADCRDIPLLPF